MGVMRRTISSPATASAHVPPRAPVRQLSGPAPSPVRQLSGRLSRTVSEVISKGERDTKKFVRKPRNLVAAALFFSFLGRVVFNHVHERSLASRLIALTDINQDHVLNSTELVKFLGLNGFEITKEQAQKLFGQIDVENDGYGLSEMARIAPIIARLPVDSHKMVKELDPDNGCFWVDYTLILAAGAGCVYLVMHSDNMEKKWAASSLYNAVLYRRMQKRCNQLDGALSKLSKERGQLESDIKRLNEAADKAEHTEELEKLKNRLEEVRSEQDQANRDLELEVSRWRHEAQKSTQEAHLTNQKLQHMMACVTSLGACVKGLDAFSGLGKGEYNAMGAQRGFSNKSIGFSMDTITFGTIDSDAKGNSLLQLYETAGSRKLGEGRDSTYRCTDLTSGQELALKMYKINSSRHTHTIHHDLYAYMSQIGKHPRIVSYERVIESENTIFVLMELISGKDLFDVVSSRVLSEEDARPLFTQLVEGLQHLHGKGVIHCDVKPENAMVVGNINARTAQVKLIDFGCSCFKKYEQNLEGCLVWDMYMPPEHSADPGLAPQISTDMWRLGCLLYVMLDRRPPFHDDAATREGRARREQARFFEDPPYPSLSPEAKDLICSLIVGDPAKRLNTEQVLQHPWVCGTALS